MRSSSEAVVERQCREDFTDRIITLKQNDLKELDILHIDIVVFQKLPIWYQNTLTHSIHTVDGTNPNIPTLESLNSRYVFQQERDQDATT